MIWKIAVCLIVGYLCGNFSTAYFIGKRHHIDIRNYGSGNAGTTNAIRTLGKKAGYATFLGDVLKVIIPALLVRFVFFGGEAYAILLCEYIGLGTVLGHCFPFWLHFKGGKGIAVTSGAIFCCDFLVAPPGIVIFALIVGITKYVSLGSLFVVTLFPIWIALRFSGNPYYIHMIIVAALFTVSGFYMHRANLKRLASGTENKIGQRVKVEEETETASQKER